MFNTDEGKASFTVQEEQYLHRSMLSGVYVCKIAQHRGQVDR